MLIVLTSKDGAGKRLDVDFDGKEYLLQDAESKYWTLKLSVEKLEEEDFLDDIRSDEPEFTYVLSYVKGEGRHAVYVLSCDYNTLHCINSWGDYQPNMTIPLNKNGNIFYRIFCTTFMVLSSTGPSAEWQGGSLGVFEYLQQHNNSPAYRQRHSVARIRPYYLYRDHGGNWLVGEQLGGTSTYLLNRTSSDSVPTNNWCYYDFDKGRWQSDPEITASPSLPSVCGVIRISLHGAAATALPETGGEYRARDWSAGRPVFSNGVTYLCVRPSWRVWCVTDSPESDGPRLLSSCVTWCPASPRAALRSNNNKSSWRYQYQRHDWIAGDIRVTCDTHRH